MRLDYEQRSKEVIDDIYRSNRARDWVGWATVPFLNKAVFKRLAKMVRKHNHQGGRMLEIGCGAGCQALMAAKDKLFDEIYGIDISSEAIAWAKEKAKRDGFDIDFRVENAVSLASFEDNFFDSVWSIASFHWIFGDDRRDCLSNIYRVLKPGGSFYLLTTCRDDSVKNSIDDTIDTKKDSFDPETNTFMMRGKPYFYLISPDEVLAEVEASGLKIIHQELAKSKDSDTPIFLGPLVVIASKPR